MWLRWVKLATAAKALSHADSAVLRRTQYIREENCQRNKLVGRNYTQRNFSVKNNRWSCILNLRISLWCKCPNHSPPDVSPLWCCSSFYLHGQNLMLKPCPCPVMLSLLWFLFFCVINGLSLWVSTYHSLSINTSIPLQFGRTSPPPIVFKVIALILYSV